MDKSIYDYGIQLLQFTFFLFTFSCDYMVHGLNFTIVIYQYLS